MSIAVSREQVLDAAWSHGCFRISICIDGDNDNNSGTNDRKGMRSLTKSVKWIEHEIESLFSSSFLRRAQAIGGTVANDATNKDDVRDGGMFAVPFPVSSSSSLLPQSTVTTTATFRGRVAESGDPAHPVPEPKLSWEYRRCCCAMSSQLAAGIDSRPSPPDGNVDGDVDDDGNDSNAAWKPLPEWTDALHSVAAMVIDLLGIPPNIVLREEGCRCRCIPNEDNDDSTRGNKHDGPCNIDLLRVFRYDAVAHDSKLTGSSPHSDWGTLTVVWQDEKGGLQTYCRACDTWSDVNASSLLSVKSTSTKLMVDKDGRSSIASFFVHVGDFLSLATIMEDGEEGGENESSMPIWPSPRHRVLCRSVRLDHTGEIEGGEDCRRSLVYFAYPPPGISLEDARRVIMPIVKSCSSSHEGGEMTKDDTITTPDRMYNWYSLLQDQSHRCRRSSQPHLEEMNGLSHNHELEGGTHSRMTIDYRENTTLLATQTHGRIRNVPFDRVIMEKWDQVQR